MGIWIATVHYKRGYWAPSTCCLWFRVALCWTTFIMYRDCWLGKPTRKHIGFSSVPHMILIKTCSLAEGTHGAHTSQSFQMYSLTSNTTICQKVRRSKPQDRVRLLSRTKRASRVYRRSWLTCRIIPRRSGEHRSASPWPNRSCNDGCTWLLCQQVWPSKKAIQRLLSPVRDAVRKIV